MRTRPRIIPPRDDVPERERWTQVAESLRETARAFDGGLALSALRVQPVELTMDGSTTDRDIRIDPALVGREHPFGVLVVYVRNVTDNSSASVSGSLPWEYRTDRGEAYVRVSSLPGLTSGKEYRIRLLILGGT